MSDNRRTNDILGDVARNLGERFLDYLRARPAECWMFFAAGVALGALIG